MKRDRINEFVEVARTIAKEQSDDLHTQTGCVIVNATGGRMLAKGSNTLPIGVNLTAERLERPLKYKWLEHAERNAIYAAAKDGTKLDGSVMVMEWFPCSDCARAIVQSGIAVLYCNRPNFELPTWGPDFVFASQILSESEVEVIYLEDINRNS